MKYIIADREIIHRNIFELHIHESFRNLVTIDFIRLSNIYSSTIEPKSYYDHTEVKFLFEMPVNISEISSWRLCCKTVKKEREKKSFQINYN